MTKAETTLIKLNSVTESDLDYETQYIHCEDDLEILRSAVTRFVRLQSETLSISLHALKKGKTNVTEDHIERVLDAMKGLLKKARQ